MEFVVSKNPTPGQFKTLCEALLCANEGDTIIIKPGIYYERPEIKTPSIKIIGEDPLTTVITYNLYAKMMMDWNEARGTFRSYSMFIDANDIYMEGITVENSAGDGREFGQALALYAEGDHLHFNNCRFLGHQDTIFTGPLPDEPITHGGFRGPKETAPRINGRQWYENCYIEGDVDFIFGCATAIFTGCTIASLNRDMEPNGYVTAPSTPKGQKFGYVFRNCEFISKGCSKQSVYLSRPWREYAKCVFVGCDFGPHIKEEGYHDWNKEIAHETTFYAEYPKVNGRVDWAKTLTRDEADRLTVKNVYWE